MKVVSAILGIAILLMGGVAFVGETQEDHC